MTGQHSHIRSHRVYEFTWRHALLASIVLCLVVLAAIEGVARVYIYLTRGTATAGLFERTVYLQYQPFVMFGPPMDVTLSPSRYPKPAKDVRRILLLGGSTAQGFPTTILEDAFAKEFRNYSFQAINGAFGGYNARQEVIVAALWGPALRPDIIISLDGANDLEHRLRTDRPGAFYLDGAYRLALERPFLSPIAHVVRESQAVQGFLRLLDRRRRRVVEEYVDAVPVYAAAEHGINVLARGLSARRIMALQPFEAFKSPLAAEEAQFTAYAYREGIMKGLYNQANAQLSELANADQVLYIDTRDSFNNLSEPIFSDDVHFRSERGYRILAERIARALSEGTAGRL